jgi:hypothetical protein
MSNGYIGRPTAADDSDLELHPRRRVEADATEADDEAPTRWTEAPKRRPWRPRLPKRDEVVGASTRVELYDGQH